MFLSVWIIMILPTPWICLLINIQNAQRILMSYLIWIFSFKTTLVLWCIIIGLLKLLWLSTIVKIWIIILTFCSYYFVFIPKSSIQRLRFCLINILTMLCYSLLVSFQWSIYKLVVMNWEIRLAVSILPMKSGIS